MRRFVKHSTGIFASVNIYMDSNELLSFTRRFDDHTGSTLSPINHCRIGNNNQSLPARHNGDGFGGR